MKQNVLINCHKHFKDRANSKKLWIQFFDNKHDASFVQNHFQHLLYVNNEKKFDQIWKNIQNIYESINDDISRYIAQKIMSKKHKWCKIWIDRYLHFNNHIFSRSKNQHATLKATLRSSQSDIDTIMKKIVDVCDRQRFAFVLTLNSIKNIYFSRLNKNIFRDLRVSIISFALIEMLHQYEKLMNARNKNISFFLYQAF